VTSEQVQQILGLLVNACLAMSTLVVFFIARYLVYKNRRDAISVEIQTEKGSQQMTIEISNNLAIPIFVTGLVWEAGVLFKNQLTWQQPVIENTEISPGRTMQLVLEGDELKALYRFLLSSLRGWPALFTARGIKIAICLAGKQAPPCRLLAYHTARSVLKAARAFLS
jgi:hypothetical protein